MRIEYHELSATESALERCAIMLPNKLQCTERASFKAQTHTVSDNAITLFICKHHLQLEMQLHPKIEFVLLDVKNQPVDEEPMKQAK